MAAEERGAGRALSALSTARLLEGNFAEVHKLLDEAAKVDNRQEKVSVARLGFLAGKLALEERRLDEASRAGHDAAAIFKETALPDEQATSEMVDAQACIERHELSAARAALDRALALIAASKGQMSRAPILITDAVLQGLEHPKQLDGPLARLRDVTVEGQRTGAQSDQWEARVESAKLEVLAR